MPEHAASPLETPLRELRGVGSERAAQLARLNLLTVGDLLLHAPRRHEDRRHFRAIKELEEGIAATTRGIIVACGLKRFRQRTQSVFEIILDDGTARLHCRWWNLPFMQNYFQTGDEVLVYGKVINLRPRTIDHPETEVIEGGEERSIHIDRIAPIYPLTEGLPQRWLRSLAWRVLGQFESAIVEPPYSKLLLDLPPRANAIRMLHFPEEITDVELARQRLALDEFIGLQLEIQGRRKRLLAKAKGLPCSGNNHLIKPFLQKLDFKLTEAQTRVLREMRHDLGSGTPMRRLLQGDVGSGKTAVAACASLMALESGFNVALMAPTEILAEQHYARFRDWFEPLGIGVSLLTGSRKTEAAPATRKATLYLGTHALLEGAFAPDRLGLVIIDEQHKFGVAQRETLLRKGVFPHLLVMTATPIPRTLGLTLYGDLDISIIDELPAGRGAVKTFVRGTDKLPKVWEFVRTQLTTGRQAYIVYPRVEDADLTKGVKAVTQEFEKIQKQLAPFKVALLHGRVKGPDKERVMTAFRRGEVQVLLATSVIEVGVDVPNATVMVIENAEQFGLAQLHQLRGRIGRGSHESHSIPVASVKTEEARQRLRVMEETNDGFKIAEADLQLRGAGELLGREQSGLPSFRFGNLADDRGLIERAREIAAGILR